MSEKQKRNIIICTLCGVLLLMAVGYAAFNTLLTINGTTSITSNWDIKITGITSKGIVGEASDEESQVVDDLKATFKANLVSPGDSITYDITVENKGNINAQLDSIDVSENTNENIKIVTSGITEGDTLNPSSTATLSVKVTYSDDVTTQPDNLETEVTITLNYVQEGMRTPFPETIDFDTVSTTNSITVTATKVSGATYEFKKDTDAYISNGKNNVYTFNEITHNTEHNIQVKITKGDQTLESAIKPIRTNTLVAPTISISNVTYTASMTFPAGCADGTYTCSYTLSGAQTGTTPVTSTSASVTNSADSSLTVKAEVNDGYNTVSQSGTISAQSASCFVAGTKVLTENGLKNIEELKIGEKVYSYNETIEKPELKPITKVYVRERYGIVTLKYEKIDNINGKVYKNIDTHFNKKEKANEIKSTWDHPYYVINKGWTMASKLEIGDRILSIDNSEIVVRSLQTNEVDKTKVYNMEVGDNHNYYVGYDNLLVHNDEMVAYPIMTMTGCTATIEPA